MPLKEKISIENFEDKKFKIKLIESEKDTEAAFTHYLHNHKNGVSQFYKKEAINYVENALIHGLSGLDRKGKLDVIFSMKDEDTLLAIVRDSGKGRDAAKAGKGKDGHISTALAVTSERLATLGSEGGLKFVDLKDDDGRASGTEVRVTIPL